MSQYLVLHTIDLRSADPKAYTTDEQMKTTKKMIKSFSDDTYCVTTWMAVGAGKAACLWEAPSEQAIIDVFARGPEMPVDGIYPVSVVDWAEMKKVLGGQ